MPIVSLTCQNQSCISKLISEWKLYDPISAKSQFDKYYGERGGSVVECRTPEREVRGSRPTAAVLCP